MKAFLLRGIIRSGREYSFRDVITIFQTTPTNNSAINVNGLVEAENTAAPNVAKYRIESARVP